MAGRQSAIDDFLAELANGGTPDLDNLFEQAFVSCLDEAFPEAPEDSIQMVLDSLGGRTDQVVQPAVQSVSDQSAPTPSPSPPSPPLSSSADSDKSIPAWIWIAGLVVVVGGGILYFTTRKPG